MAGFEFKVLYEPGTKNPCDYGSRHPTPGQEDGKQADGEDQETDMIVNRVMEDQLPPAITRKMLRRATEKD